MSADGPDGGGAPAVTDAPFRGSVDPLGPRRQRFAIRQPPRPPNVRVPYAIAALALGALGSASGQIQLAITFGGIGMLGVGDWFHGRYGKRPATTVDIHERGLRLDHDLAWAELWEVIVDTTPDQRRAPTTLTLATRDAPTTIAGTAAAVAPLVAAIEAAVGPRQHREAVARLAAGHGVRYGRHAFTEDGLRTRDTLVPWRDLGPMRRFGGGVVCDSKLGEFTAPIADVPNPWVLERLIAERGWLA